MVKYDASEKGGLVTCPECKNENPEGANFCMECGTKLGTSKNLSNRQAILEAERRRITALFSDLSGYTAMTSKLDPEEVKSIMNTIFDGMKEIILKYGGFIEHSAGDSVLALFGVPKAHEDDTIRAIYTAKEIHTFVDSLSPDFKEKTGITLSMHSGINTGLAVTADVNQAKGTHKVTGDVINVAARLSGVAKAHEILVGPETYKICSNAFAFDALPSVKVKGKEKPIVMYRVTVSNQSTIVRTTNRQVTSEMVGRDRELDKLEIQVLKVINGKGSVVNISGEAGIGKSRLIAELKKREVIKRVAVLKGRSISIGRNLSFHPIIDLFKQWADISEDDLPSRAFDKFEIAIRSVNPEEADEILPFIATLMGLPLRGKYAERVKGIEGEALEKLITKNVRSLLIKTSQLQPTVLIMEDLHWADASSIELLEVLFILAESHRVLFINVFRPGYLDDKHYKLNTIGERLSVYFVDILIRPLEEVDSEALIQNMLEVKGIPHNIRNQIVERTNGNPFFIEEVVRSLIDQGAVVKTETGFRVDEKINTVIIPPNINDVLISRIDRLEEKTRELVKVASVIGRSFFERIIKNVAETIEDLDERLSYLKDIQLIRDRVRMQEIEYFFKHALAQEAAYDSLLLKRRKELHLKVAGVIERIFQDRLPEFYGILSYHYSSGENFDKAEEYMLKAGKESLKSSASSEALYYFQKALKLYLGKYGDKINSEKINNIEKNIALALFNQAKHTEAVEYLNKTLAYYGEDFSQKSKIFSKRMLISLFNLANILYFPKSKFNRVPDKQEREIFNLLSKKLQMELIYDPKTSFINSLYVLYKTSPFQDGLKILTGVGGTFAYSGMSFKLSKKILTICKNYSIENDTQSIIYYELAVTCLSVLSGENDLAKEYNDDLVNDNLRIGDLFFATAYTAWQGLKMLNEGLLAEAQRMMKKLSYIHKSFSNYFAGEWNYLLRIMYLIKIRKLYEALKYIEKGIAFSKNSGMADNTLWIFQFLCLECRTKSLLKDIQGASESLQKAKDIMPSIVLPFHTVPFHLSEYLLIILQLQNVKLADNNNQVRMDIERALKKAKLIEKASKKAFFERTESLKLIGVAYWEAGNQKKALQWFEKAIVLGVRVNSKVELSRVYFEIGKRLLDSHSKYKKLKGIDGESYLKKAKDSFKEINLLWDMEQLERFKMGNELN